MYYVYFGENVAKTRMEALKTAASLAGEERYTTITSEAPEDVLESIANTASLFAEREVYVLDGLSSNPEMYSKLTALLPELQDSTNAFVLIEGKLGVKEEKVLAKHSEKTFHFPAQHEKEFNVFALTDALIARDKKALWVLLMDAWRSGKTSEEIIGTLHWQLKTIRLALHTKSADEAGLKPFVYEKSKRALRNFSKDEIEHRAHDLVLLYHDGHSGRRDIQSALEAWVLSL